MVEKYRVLTDDTFYRCKYVDMIQRHYGIKDLRKESQNKDSEFYGQYDILKDIFQTFKLVIRCFFSDSNVGIVTQAKKACEIIDELIYKNETSQKHKYSSSAIKELCDTRARRLYNLMVSLRNDDLLNIEANKTKVLDRLKKEMKELEEVGFDNIVIDNITYKKNSVKYYKGFKKYISKFDYIYSKRDDFIKEFRDDYYKHYGIVLTDDDIDSFTKIFTTISYGNNGFINVITESGIDTTNLNYRLSDEEIYKIYLNHNGINYDSADYLINASAFRMCLEFLYKKVNARIGLDFIEVLCGYDLFSFLTICEETIMNDKLEFSFVANDMNKILKDLKDVYKVLTTTQMTLSEVKEDNQKYYNETLIPAYKIIKDIIKRNKDLFMEMS